ncbi:hypothetical protein [Rhodoferax lacus]|uniref:hypothetical protein n=1 Tax=Rhodoferax lacus TaxID=2184758 RepID=UPI0011C1561F|nr:hypothetical protein [Rhodoferax lacus]
MQFLPSVIGSSNGKESILPADSVFQVRPFLNKLCLEYEHLQHFKKLVFRQHPTYAFELIENVKEDPPDFRIKRGGKIIGLELTAYTPSTRRKQVAFFGKIQDQFLQAHRCGALRNLQGVYIELSFKTDDGTPKKVDEKTFVELTQAFSKLSPRRDKKNRICSNGGNPYPLGESGETNDGGIGWYVYAVSETPSYGTALANETGFDINYVYRRWTDSSEVFEELQNRIDAKDHGRNGTEELLISAGAPSLDGWVIASESTCMAHCIKEWTGPKAKPKHLKRIFLDIWGADQLHILYEANQ